MPIDSYLKVKCQERGDSSRAGSHVGAAKIFISYRRQDSGHAVGRLYDQLERSFGRRSVFMDINDVPLGADLRDHLHRAVEASEFVVVAIGPNWLTAADADGNPRLENPSDFVRMEVEMALALNKRVIPVLLDGALVPSPSQLPEGLRPLAYLNALAVDHRSFHADAERLVRGIGADSSAFVSGPLRRSLETLRGQIALSHAPEDDAVAERISSIFRESGYGVVKFGEYGRKDAFFELERMLAERAHPVMVVSENFRRSEIQPRHLAIMLAAAQAGTSEPPTILRIDKSSFSGLLATIGYIDLSSLIEVASSEHNDQLAAVVRGALDRSRSSREGELASLYRADRQTILHAEIHAAPRFTGRDRALNDLDEALRMTDNRPVIVSGMAGAGKSSLAREWAWRNRGTFQGVWWVRGEARELMVADLAALGATLTSSADVSNDLEETARGAVRLIEQAPGRPWLLIFDNVSNARDLEGIVPQRNAKVVLTSTAAIGAGPSIQVGAWTRHESVDYLLARARMELAPNTRMRAAADQVAEILGDLPLALEQARAYCLVEEIGYDSYRDLLVARLGNDRSGSLFGSDERNVQATFAIAMDRAAESCPAAHVLMSVLAFVAPDQVPLSVIDQELMSQSDRGAAIDALAETSLIALETLNDEVAGLSVHRLVQQAARDRLKSRGGYREALAWAGQLVAKAFPYESDDPTQWEICARIQPHAFAVLASADRQSPPAPVLLRLLNQVGVNLISHASHAKAEDLLKRGVALATETFGPDHAVTAISFNNLARVYQETGRLEEAERILRRILDVFEMRAGSEIGANHWVVLNNLAGVLIENRRLEEAEPLLYRALEVVEGMLGPDHPSVAVALNNLANLLQETNRLAEAEQSMRRALAITELALGANHPALATRLHNLAVLSHALGNMDEAHVLMERALAVTEAGLGGAHPNVANRMRNLAWLNHAAGRSDAAETLMRRALEITMAREAERDASTLDESPGDVSTPTDDGAAVAREASVTFDRGNWRQGEVVPPEEVGSVGAFKASARDADFRRLETVSDQNRVLAAGYLNELDRELDRFKRGLAMSEVPSRTIKYTEGDIIEYLRTASIDDADELLDFAYHLGELYDHKDLAAASVLARSERHAAENRTAVGSLLALIAMETSLRAANKTLLNRSAQVFAQTKRSEKSSIALDALQALTAS